MSRFRYTRTDIVQFLKYFVGTTSYFWAGYGVFALCYTGFSWSWFPAKMLADLIGWTLNYFIQRYWAFAAPSLAKREGVTVQKYTLLTAVDFGLDYLMIWGLKAVGISPYVGFFISAGFFTLWNYAWYRFWVFKAKKPGTLKEVGA